MPRGIRKLWIALFAQTAGSTEFNEGGSGGVLDFSTSSASYTGGTSSEDSGGKLDFSTSSATYT